MKAEIEAVLGHALAAWRYRWQALACMWLVALMGWCAVYLMADQFESKAQIRVDTTSVLKPLLQGIAVSADSQTQTDIVRRALLAKPTLEAVARDSGMMARAKTIEQSDKLLQRLSQDIHLSGNPETGLYSIAFVDRDPRMAQRVVQRLLDTFVTDSFGANRADTEHAQQFLREQVKEYSDRLSDSERKLAEFKKQYLGMMPSQNGDYFQRLQTEQLNLDKLRGDLDVSIRRRDELRRKLAGTTQAHTAPVNIPTAQQIQDATSLDARLQDSKRQLDELLLKYTDRHPDVIALRETIQRLEERRRAELGNVRATTTTSSSSNGNGSVDGVLQELQIELNAQDIQTTTLEAQVEQSQRRLADLRKLLSNGPEIEAQLSRLNRDYGVTKAQYDQLLQRLESAKISGDAERNPNVKFKVLDPPRLPIRPVAPRRGIFLGVVLFGAVVLGALTAFVLSQAKPVFMTVNSVQTMLGVPVVGVVGRMLLPEEQPAVRRGRLGVAVAAASLLATFVVAVLFSHSGSAWLRAALRLGVS